MNQIESFIEYLSKKDKPENVVSLARDVLTDFSTRNQGEEATLETVRSYCDRHVAGTDNALNRIVILFWYFDFVQNKACSTYLITLFGTLGVLESQQSRMAMLMGKETAESVFANLTFPAIGSDLASYPARITAYIRRMRDTMDEKDCRKVLAGNHHNVDAGNFSAEKELFEKSTSLEVFLKEKHARLIETLSHHAETGKMWFEQHITPEVVAFVKAHQEIQTGIIDGNHIITQKIPYNPDAWLHETDPQKKRYYACHCPFARESIMRNEHVPSLWCYCSGGFTKLFFDTLFDQDLEVELLESVLDGDDCCKFSIRLPDQDNRINQ